jgi:hypothetical protein
MEINGERRYTTAEAAQTLGRSLNTVRVYVSRHNLGVWVGNQRLLSDADLAQIRKARVGAPKRKRRAQPQPSPAPVTEVDG